MKPFILICLFALSVIALANPLKAKSADSTSQPDPGPLRQKEFAVSKKYLVLPMSDKGSDCMLKLSVDGKKVQSIWKK